MCNVFYTCVNGEYIEAKCQGTLLFDEYAGTCAWPENANRENCEEKKTETKDGFVCPQNPNRNDISGQVIAHPHYAHPEDCQKFYVCLNSVEPRELKCDEGEVFNDESKRCDNPAYVPGCENWFDALEEWISLI